MAQLHIKKTSSSPKTPGTVNQISPTFEQLLRDDAHLQKSVSPRGFGTMDNDQEEYMCSTPNKKSVLTKVKERAKKLRSSLSIKKKQIFETNDWNESTTPSSSVNLDDCDEEGELYADPEYLGAPMYESEAAPESLRETARQHPRAEPVVSDKKKVPKVGHHAQEDKPVDVESNTTIAKDVSDNAQEDKPVDDESNRTMAKVVSDATQKITSKIVGLTVATTETQDEAATPSQCQPEEDEKTDNVATINTTDEKTKMDKDLEEPSYFSSTSTQSTDKGVSIREYLRIKLEPGEDERALSQVISEAISPKKSGSDFGVVEKMKGVVTSLFKHETTSMEPQKASPRVNFSPDITQQKECNKAQSSKSCQDPQQVNEEENEHGRILQPN